MGVDVIIVDTIDDVVINNGVDDSTSTSEEQTSLLITKHNYIM